MTETSCEVSFRRPLESSCKSRVFIQRKSRGKRANQRVRVSWLRLRTVGAFSKENNIDRRTLEAIESKNVNLLQVHISILWRTIVEADVCGRGLAIDYIPGTQQRQNGYENPDQVDHTSPIFAVSSEQFRWGGKSTK